MKGIKAVITAASDETRSALFSMCSEADITDVTVTDGMSVKPLFEKQSFDIALLVLPLGEQFGAETVSFLDRNYDTRLIVLVPSKTHEEVCRRLSGTGALILPRSASKPQIVNILRSERNIISKLRSVEDEKENMIEMVNETKLVNRAKCVLIEYLRISEKDAHRQIQKRAMDRRITLAEAASDILKTYDYNR